MADEGRKVGDGGGMEDGVQWLLKGTGGFSEALEASVYACASTERAHRCALARVVAPDFV